VTWLGEEGLIPRLRWLATGLVPAARATPPRRPAVIGHRGAARHAPENTVASFARSVELGAEGVEADVCATADGIFVLWHDADPDDLVARVRQAGREGLLYSPEVPETGSPDRRKVAEQTLEHFLERHAYRRTGESPPGAPDSPPRAEVEILERLFEWAAGEPRLRRIYLDVKLPPEQAGHAASLAAELSRGAASGAIPGRLAIRTISPQREIYERLRDGLRSSAGADLAPIADFELSEARKTARRIGARRVGLGLGRRIWRGFRAEAADLVAARDAGEFDEVFLWTINGRSRLAQAARIGPDALLTDEPEILRGILG
jgi:glycerophosphoryl diester phosphodiesterase